MRSLAHVIVSFPAVEGSVLAKAQHVTHRTMLTAKLFSHNELDIQLFSANYWETRNQVPDFFTVLPSLIQSLDVGEEAPSIKYPLLEEVLGNLYEVSKAEWFVYTNVGVGVQPHFYSYLGGVLDRGYDAVLLRKRLLTKTYSGDDNEIPLMYGELGEGVRRSYDCFVFRREAVPTFKLDITCVGLPGFEAVLRANILKTAKNPKLVKSGHVTFHQRDVWNDLKKDERYVSQNRLTALRVLQSVGSLDLSSESSLANVLEIEKLTVTTRGLIQSLVEQVFEETDESE